MLPYFEAMNDLAISAAIRESLWVIAVINTMHLLFLVMFAGAVLIVDLRLLGRGAREQPLAHVARDAQPWLIAALIGLTLTGIPQFLSNALREYHSYLFWMKMAVLLVALDLYIHAPPPRHARGRGTGRTGHAQGRRPRLDRALDGGRHPGAADRFVYLARRPVARRNPATATPDSTATHASPHEIIHGTSRPLSCASIREGNVPSASITLITATASAANGEDASFDSAICSRETGMDTGSTSRAETPSRDIQHPEVLLEMTIENHAHLPGSA